jgi:hypothetical protein
VSYLLIESHSLSRLLLQWVPPGMCSSRVALSLRGYSLLFDIIVVYLCSILDRFMPLK